MENEPNGTPPSPTPEPTPTPAPSPTPEPNPNATPDPNAVAEIKPAEAAPEFVPLTPEDLSFPEGAQIDDALRSDFLALINDREITPKDQANKLVELSGRLMTAASEANSAAWDKVQTEWQEETKTAFADQFQPTLDSVAKLVEEFGSPELRQVLDLTGAGNSVHMVRFLSTIAGKLTEGSIPPLSGTPAATTSAAQRMFPSMK